LHYHHLLSKEKKEDWAHGGRRKKKKKEFSLTFSFELEGKLKPRRRREGGKEGSLFYSQQRSGRDRRYGGGKRKISIQPLVRRKSLFHIKEIPFLEAEHQLPFSPSLHGK